MRARLVYREEPIVVCVYRFITRNLCIIQVHRYMRCMRYTSLRVSSTSMPARIARASSFSRRMHRRREIGYSYKSDRRPIQRGITRVIYIARAHARGLHDKFCSPAIITPQETRLALSA
jgi:hypothetical protein